MNGRHWLGLGAVAVALLVAGCGGEDAARDLGTRAVVIGIDGADWKIIDALAAEGRMPHFSRLRTQSVWGRI